MTATTPTPPTPIKADLLYGCAAIGEFLDLSAYQVQHQVDAGRIPHFRIGKTICATRAALTAWLNDLATGSPLVARG